MISVNDVRFSAHLQIGRLRSAADAIAQRDQDVPAVAGQRSPLDLRVDAG
jgi:hypothetical protein